MIWVLGSNACEWKMVVFREAFDDGVGSLGIVDDVCM